MWSMWFSWMVWLSISMAPTEVIGGVEMLDFDDCECELLRRSSADSSSLITVDDIQ